MQWDMGACAFGFKTLRAPYFPYLLRNTLIIGFLQYFSISYIYVYKCNLSSINHKDIMIVVSPVVFIQLMSLYWLYTKKKNYLVTGDIDVFKLTELGETFHICILLNLI